MAQSSRVLVVDDHPLFREALAASLDRIGEAGGEAMEVAHAASLADALAALAEDDFRLVLLDLQLSDTDSLDGVARLRAAQPALPLYVVSAAESPDVIRRARELGAQGYLPKTLPPDALVDALQRALALEPVFPEGIDEAEAGDDDAARRVASLTPSQARVMEGLAAGLLNKQIAWEMNISEATVKAHMTAILRKLGANNRTQALLVYRSATSLDSTSGA